jgi:hypothetical protein
MEWSSVTPWSRSGVEERSHSNSVEWSGVEWLVAAPWNSMEFRKGCR